MLTGAVAVCLLAGAPAANAVFSRTVNAGTMSVGARLAVPTGNAVTAFCTLNGSSGKYRVTIAVTGRGTVPRATGYILTVKDSTGAVRYTADLASGVAAWASTGAPASGWSYTIDAQYKASPTSTWTSTAVAVPIC